MELFMKIKAILFTGILFTISSAASANQYVTGGLGFGDLNLDHNDVSTKPEEQDFSQVTINGAYGYKFNDFLGAEAKLNIGASDEDDLKAAATIGVYLKAGYTFNEVFEIHALAGYARTNFTIRDNDDVSANYDSFSYGIEADFNISKSWAVGANYMSYLTDTEKAIIDKKPVNIDIDYSTVGIFARYSF